ncbi:MAG: 6-phosphofructokinase [Thermoleophilia bacterium]|nr:6-phosphofructokinase [Thermoleophilia bacterium]
MKIGILTGGGDCPGLNAVISSVARRSWDHGHELIGFKYGWRGVIEDDSIPLTRDVVRGIMREGGTILRSSGDNPAHGGDRPERALATLKKHQVDALIVIGGEGTMKGALTMHRDHGLAVVGVPKTIDNDLPGTELTVGFDSALAIATEALDRLATTAESHDRVMVCEVMGRTAGWLAMYAGIAGGADVILLPEMDMSVEEASEIVTRRHGQGRDSSLIVVGEGYNLRSTTGLFDDVNVEHELDAYGFPRLGGISNHVAHAVEQLTGFETRVTILGHVQRGGPPTARDRALASRFGFLAADLVHEGNFGQLVAQVGRDVLPVPLEQTEGDARVIPEDVFEFVRSFMG